MKRAVVEIVGLAGVDGNGQQELAEAIVGLIAARRVGAYASGDKDVTDRSIGARIALSGSPIFPKTG